MDRLGGHHVKAAPSAPTRIGRIILLNGASSAGKSTLAKALQRVLDEPFLHVSSDHLAVGLPQRRDAAGPFQYWGHVRPRFFDGFHRSLAALAEAGNDLIVDHIIEFDVWRTDLQRILQPFDVFLVGVHCAVDEIERRERQRGDRWLGEGRSHLDDGIHTFGSYDCDVDTTGQEPADVAAHIVRAWQQRSSSALFEQRAHETG